MKKGVFYTLACVLLCCLFTITGCGASEDQFAYRNAEADFEKGAYDSARGRFALLSEKGYKDSAIREKQCIYELGLIEKESADYQDALDWFYQIPDYEDSLALADECVELWKEKYAEEILERTGSYDLPFLEDLSVSDIRKEKISDSKYGELYNYKLTLSSEQFQNIKDEDKLTVMEIANQGSTAGIMISGTDEYSVENRDLSNYLSKNGEFVFERLISDSPTYVEPRTTSAGKCLVCNGTGYVRYYYGSSSLEAFLSGHDDYTSGPCPSCHGTGKE